MKKSIIKKKKKEGIIDIKSAFDIENPSIDENYSEDYGYFVTRADANAISNYIASIYVNYSIFDVNSGWGLNLIPFLREDEVKNVISFNNKINKEITKNNVEESPKLHFAKYENFSKNFEGGYFQDDVFLENGEIKFGREDIVILFLNPGIEKNVLSGAMFEGVSLEDWIQENIGSFDEIFLMVPPGYNLKKIEDYNSVFKRFSNSQIYRISGSEIEREIPKGQCRGEVVEFTPEDEDARKEPDFFGETRLKTASYHIAREEEWKLSLSAFIKDILSNTIKNSLDQNIINFISDPGNRNIFSHWEAAFTTSTFDPYLGDEFDKYVDLGGSLLRLNFGRALEAKLDPNFSSVLDMERKYLNDQYLQQISINKRFHDYVRVVGIEESKYITSELIKTFIYVLFYTINISVKDQNPFSAYCLGMEASYRFMISIMGDIFQEEPESDYSFVMNIHQIMGWDKPGMESERTVRGEISNIIKNMKKLKRDEEKVNIFYDFLIREESENFPYQIIDVDENGTYTVSIQTSKKMFDDANMILRKGFRNPGQDEILKDIENGYKLSSASNVDRNEAVSLAYEIAKRRLLELEFDYENSARIAFENIYSKENIYDEYILNKNYDYMVIRDISIKDSEYLTYSLIGVKDRLEEIITTNIGKNRQEILTNIYDFITSK